MTDENEQKTIESDFIQSWNLTEQIYNSSEQHIPRVRFILELIKELRERGYDRQLRAGTQLLTFIVSRARFDGLKQGQYWIRFEAKPEGGARITCRTDIIIEFEIAQPKITSEIEALLARLLAQPID